MSGTLAQARGRLEADGIRFVQIEVAELDGALRGKLVPLAKALEAEIGFCTTLLTSTTADDVYEAPFASFEHGFRDFFAAPQIETIRCLPWRPDTAAVICDMYDAGGTMTPESPRTALHKAVDRAADMGFEARAAIEFAAVVFDVDEEDGCLPSVDRSTAQEHGGFRPIDTSALRGIVEEFARRMSAIDAPLESAQAISEPGAMQFALEPSPALEAGDRAMRAKAYLKELCTDNGLIASFMARPDMAGPGHGGHVRLSLWRDGKCAFEADGGIADIARHYVTGQRAHLPDLVAFCMPNINSYRRADWSWMTGEPWGDHGGAGDQSAVTRLAVVRRELGGVIVENRLPGADTNAYLTIAGMLAAGLDGIAAGLREPPNADADGSVGQCVKRLPTTLEQATERLDRSAFLRSAFGDRFVDHYVFSRRIEHDYWEKWLTERVTDWELRRYLETV